MHARKNARDAWLASPEDDAFFAPRGDVVFSDSAAARRFSARVNTHPAADVGGGLHALSTRPAELAAMVLVHEVFHTIVNQYRRRSPQRFAELVATANDPKSALGRFIATFPPPAVYRGQETPEQALARPGALESYAEEALLLWVVNQNPAYEAVRPIVTDGDLGEPYQAFVESAQQFFAKDEPFGPKGETLLELLLAPGRTAPNSIFDQLAMIEGEWGPAFHLEELAIWRRLMWARDMKTEEGRWFMRGGPGPGAPLLDAMRFDHEHGAGSSSTTASAQEEPKNFSYDLEWMPRVVLIAKTVFVWLDQLSKKYNRSIDRLDQIPDEELDTLAQRGFTGLWLIGLFERSRASKKIKQMRGAEDAVASAYSLKGYAIADELGGYPAYENLKARSAQRGLRLAADMVPNHVGIDADWVIEHPHWFLQAPNPPFPAYKFSGTNLSDDPRVSVFIEDGYWNNSDAAVVFRRHDNQTGADTYIYHGNDGTSMPWNDTAQLDYTRAEVRHAVIETILHVARLFPIIRFDAAMTLAKRHYKRLWFPMPGAGDGIPSRSDHAMSQEEFDRVFPEEFWREVVDTVKERAPDTLLLAEAFWMMEGYFVRSLGMHRVYNSAFMNMLKREENAKYRETVKNVLSFDPEILKRFVNFMNNPDEETAVEQFGSDDKYFGVCILMATMPGLPMFGHGQVEGLHEKYGMEYRRAKKDEHPDEHLVWRHEREIFPLLKKRYVFSGVKNFAFYDFIAEDGSVAEDVYAYSNSEGGERAVVLFNNKFGTVRGRIALSVGLATSEGDWVVFRDVPNQLEYIRAMREVVQGGLFWQLDAFKYHVLMDLRGVVATPDKPYDKLAADLAGQGVPSIERAVTALRFKPLHAPLAEALNEKHLGYLAEAPEKEATAAFVERIGFMVDGIAYMVGRSGKGGKSIETKSVVDAATRRFAAIRGLAAGATPYLRPVEAKAKPNDPVTEAVDKLDVRRLMTWLHVEIALDLVAPLTPDRTRAQLANDWEMALPLCPKEDWNTHQRAAVVLALATLPKAPLREAMHAALNDPRARRYLGIHEAGGTEWIVKEPWLHLAGALAEREAVLGTASLALARRQELDTAKLAEKHGWRADEVDAALTPVATKAVTKPKPTKATPKT